MTLIYHKRGKKDNTLNSNFKIFYIFISCFFDMPIFKLPIKYIYDIITISYHAVAWIIAIKTLNKKSNRKSNGKR